MSKKPIIVFEGIEGSGKSHHLTRILRFFKKNNIKFIKIREPGGSINSEKIRNFLLDKKNNFNKNTDLFLYLASRSENIELIRKNYKKKIILIDRFIDSTIAYQHFGFGIDIKLIEKLNNYLLKDIKVNFTFLNLVNKKNMIKRLKIRKNLNRYDRFKYEFYNKVQKGFVKLSKKNEKKYKIIDSNLDIKTNEQLILKQIKKLI